VQGLLRKLSGGRQVAVSFIGEGAANQGAFHEALNLAAVWAVPVVFVIEDNAYGISVSKRDRLAVEQNRFARRRTTCPECLYRATIRMPSTPAAGEAISRARRGEGPSLIEIETCRLEGHFMGDAEGYRPNGESSD